MVRESHLVKTILKEEDVPRPKKVSQISYGLLSGKDMMRLSTIDVHATDFYDMNTHQPMKYGCLDRRMGVSSKAETCDTCHQKVSSCPGHFGSIHLAFPVFHIGYFNAILEILRCICKKCARVLISEDEREYHLKRMLNKNADVLHRRRWRKEITELCKKTTICPWCGAFNGDVKKVPGAPTFKLIHDPFKNKSSDAQQTEYFASFNTAIQKNPEMAAYVNKAEEDLNPQIVYDLFCQIPSEDLPLLWINEMSGRPESLIFTDILVPPVCIRPSVLMESVQGSNEDDITVILQDILRLNAAIQDNIDKGSSIKVIMDFWNHLQNRVGELINGDLPGVPATEKRGIPKRSFIQRLKGKQGRFRGNLSGKRVEFSGRTVISPDPNLSIEEVGVPVFVATHLTYPERVTAYNIKRLREMVINGPNIHPGANLIRKVDDLPINLNFADKIDAAKHLRIGDIVERHLINGDVSLFNRQPSLHRMSIMSHKVRVLPYKTFRFNECCCSPYNADFDGDEMNIHIPQTEEARIEARELMGIRYNIVNPRNGQPLITATQDFITGSYVLTQRDTFFTLQEFCRIAAFSGDAEDDLEIPIPAIIAPIPLWTGKQIYTTILRPNNHGRIHVSLEIKAGNFKGPSSNHYNVCMCPNDGYVIIQDSELICGNICKNTIGGKKKGLIFMLARDHEPQDVVYAMGRITKLTSRFLRDWGFTIGIDDVTPSKHLLDMKMQVIKRNYEKCDEIIKEFKEGNIKLKPGCNADQTLENECVGLLSEIRDTIGKSCMTSLPRTNYPLIMATCGSKGSAINICQMMACVGQQVVSGKRIEDGFIRRTLPHFLPNAKEPKAKGFVANSFYDGLEPEEFFFHTMGGREGLVDSAVKTADTGYMQRRLMKALEDMTINYDNTVRTACGEIVQLTYGDDGLNPSYMEDNSRPVDFIRLYNYVRITYPDHINPPLLPWEIRDLTHYAVNEKRFQDFFIGKGSHLFLDELEGFGEDLAKNIEKLREDLCLEEEMEKKEGEESIERYMNGTHHHAKYLQFDNSESLRAFAENAKIYNSKEYIYACEQIINNCNGITYMQLQKLFDIAWHKYRKAIVEPGEAVGALSGQSFGEPATQMTLKTFHFAGVASMDITQGVPRIKEIINAATKISTPIITVELQFNNSETSARIVKGRLEKTVLGEVCECIKEIYSPSQCYLDVKLNMDIIKQLYLQIDSKTVRQSILAAKKLKLKPEYVTTQGDSDLRIFPPPPQTTSKAKANSFVVRGRDQYFSLQRLKEALPHVIVKGIPSVHRAVLNKVEDKKGGSHLNLLIDGTGLLEVFGIPGVNHKKTCTNHILEVQGVLGIEAARTLIIREVSYTYDNYGLTIDLRHQMLLSDCMTFRGQVLGITRFGIEKMRDSVLTLASFEKTADHLFDASLHGRVDDIIGVSDCIILGVPIKIGTGLFGIMHSPVLASPLPGRKKPFLE
ncbi:hypothetical protein WA158_008168 [Blastocystis sp. Blastoise]